MITKAKVMRAVQGGRAPEPTDDQLDVAAMWLAHNEGDELTDCMAVAAWLDWFRNDRFLREEARKAGIPVAKLRKRFEAIAKAALSLTQA